MIDLINEKKLTNKLFMSIIDLITLIKIYDVSTWFKFGKICWLLGYPCKYWDYYSKRNIRKYNYEDNLTHYRYTYKEDKHKLINVLNKIKIERK